MKLTEKQKNCKFCHESGSFVPMTSSWGKYTQDVAKLWETAFKRFIEINDEKLPEAIVHGRTNGKMMLVWTKGHQNQTAVLFNLEFDDPHPRLQGSVIDFYNCPMCGRRLKKETK